MTYEPLTCAALAAAVAGTTDDRLRRSWVREFVRSWSAEPAGERHHLTDAAPALTGDERWDALVTGLAEYVCAPDDVRGPAWADGHVLRTFWFPDDTPAGRACALRDSPASLARRGVFIPWNELENV